MSHPIRVTKLVPNLLIGSQFHCFYHYSDEVAVVHACQAPCHQHAVGYRNSLATTHPNNWFLEDRNHLYLNIVNAERLTSYTPAVFVKAMSFIKSQIDDHQVLIHSNEAFSRAPAIALLYMAKVAGAIDGVSYDAAATDFGSIYPQYQPKRGIVTYLRREWAKLDLPSEG